MSSYYELKEAVRELPTYDVKDYLLRYFVPSGLKDYMIPSSASDLHKEALRFLFESTLPLETRIDEVLEIDPLCREAVLIYSYIYDPTAVYFFFRDYSERFEESASFEEYDLLEYHSILSEFVDYYLDTTYLTGALFLQSMILKMKNCTEMDYNRMAMIVAILERGDLAWELFLEHDFTDPVGPLLILVTLLKNGREDRAREVYHELLQRYEAAFYLDHMWDLNEADDNNVEFESAVDDVFAMICSYPDFFSWCALNKDVENNSSKA